MCKSKFNGLRAAFLLSIGLLVAGCAQPMNKATKGGLAGAALGAGTGAIIGSQTGHAGAGTAIGAGIGALGGALVGNTLDAQDEKTAQLRDQVSQNQALIDENRRLIEELKRRGADVRSSSRGVVINLPDILFQFDSYRLTPEAQRTIGEIGGVLKTVEHRTIAVEGHTDAIGTVDYNKKLSLSRARSVADELSSEGVSRGRMTIEGYGEGSPIATNNNPEGRARNRRVEVIVEN